MTKQFKTTMIAAVCALALPMACADDDSSAAPGSTSEATTNADGSGTAVDGSGTADDGYAFAEDDPSAYARVDRIGLPGVNTALIMSKDAYNQADPANDADFVPEISATVTALHDALDDDIMMAGLVPCAPEDCLAVAGPIAVPDTIKIDPAMPSGFPNGRQLDDQAMDIILAVLLLDMGTDGQDPGTLAGLPLNPAANDLPFSGSFPYLAEPHG